MVKDITTLADMFRQYYKCNNAPGVVENMLLAVAGRTPDSKEDLTREELIKVSAFVRNPPFKERLVLSPDEKGVLASCFVFGAAMGLWAWCCR